MLIQNIFQTVAKFAFGKEIALALVLLKLIGEALRSHNSENIARFVYEKLPGQWRSPEGPVTEAEFVAMIQAGQDFLEKVQAVLKR